MDQTWVQILTKPLISYPGLGGSSLQAAFLSFRASQLPAGSDSGAGEGTGITLEGGRRGETRVFLPAFSASGSFAHSCKFPASNR